MHGVCFNTTSRTLTALASEALVNRIMKNCKGEQLHWAEKMLVEEVTKYTAGKLMDPRMESKELSNSQRKEGPLESTLGRIRGDECIQQLGASDAIVAASSKKKDGTAIVSQGIDIVKSPYQRDNEHPKVRALVGLCKQGASGGSDAALRPFADGSSIGLQRAAGNQFDAFKAANTARGH